jgi:methylmalonyl-CoA mutase C-terminal domain/subunit
MARKIRVVIAKPGLDGHDRGAKIIARALRDAGMEVITPVCTRRRSRSCGDAIQRTRTPTDSLRRAHDCAAILDGLENGVDALVLVGGTIPNEDAEEFKRGRGRRRRFHSRRADERDRQFLPRRSGLARAATA